jgi:para-nitrobenzyl esterase
MRFQGLTDLEKSEDCLYLNVWTPGLDGARRPVLVWIHGGGFRSGTGAEPAYDGAELAQHGDAVVVTLNYRLGALGFLALPQLAEDPEHGANFGLLDQLAALRWVHEHADRLGGDPANVTLFGQSAGAMSIATLLGLPRAQGLFQRAILQSGAAHNVSSPQSAERIAEVFLKEVDLAPEQASRLRELPLEALVAAQQRTADRSSRYASLTFQPHVDGHVVPRPPLEEIAAGRAKAVSVLIGTNLDEWNLFGATDSKVRGLDEKRLLRRLERIFPQVQLDSRALLARVAAAYGPNAAGRVAQPRELWSAIESDRHFHQPAIRLAEQQSAHQRQTYRYLFTWPSPALGGALGSCHGLDIPCVFGTLHQPVLARFTGRGEEVEQLSARMQRAWIAFARSGDPSHEELGTWPTHDTEKRATMLLGAHCEVREAPLEERRRFWSAFL